MIAVAAVDACGTREAHAPHLRKHMWPRDDGKPHNPPWLWCLGEYDQHRQARRVVVRWDDDTETLVGEGLTLVGSAYRPVREPRDFTDAGCGECRHPEDFGWDSSRWENGAPVIVCHAHGALAPGWAYDVEVGLDAWRNPDTRP